MQKLLHAMQNFLALVPQLLKLLHSVFVSGVKSPKNAGFSFGRGSVKDHGFAMYILKARARAYTSNFHLKETK